MRLLLQLRAALVFLSPLSLAALPRTTPTKGQRQGLKPQKKEKSRERDVKREGEMLQERVRGREEHVCACDVMESGA